MGALSLQDASGYAMRGLAWAGMPKKKSSARKYAITTAAGDVVFPVDAAGNHPSLMRISVPSGALVYGDFTGKAAVVPTTSADGSARILDGDIISPWGGDRISMIAEANATITITFVWV